MALGLFAKLKKRKTVVPELNKAAIAIFQSKVLIAKEKGFVGVLELITSDVLARINDINERRSLVNMMIVQEMEPDVIIHIRMASEIKNHLESSFSPAKSDDEATQFLELCKFYDNTIDWLFAAGFMSKEQAEDLKGNER